MHGQSGDNIAWLIMEGRVADLLKISRAIDKLNEKVGHTAMWCVLIAVLVSSVNAIIRKAFDVSSNSWLELQWNLFGAVFMLCAAYTFLRNEHIRIDIVSSKLSRQAQLRIDMVGHVLFLMPFVLIMLYDSIPFALKAITTNEQSFNAGGLPTWPGKVFIPIGFFLLFLQAISEMIKTRAIMRGELPDPVEEQEAANLELAKFIEETAKK
jgi:TRAP-type mannitol/chloroaromatic compound transport system permease small subunit